MTPLLRGVEEAIGAIQKEQDPDEREKILERIVAGIPRHGLSVAASFLQHQEASEAARELGARLIRRWAGNDLQAVADWAAQMPEGDGRDEVVRQLAVAWVDHDLAGAVRWAGQLPADDQPTALLGIAYEAARTEPVEALKLAMALPAGGPREDLVAHTASQWAAQDAAAAADWAAKIEDEELRTRVLTGVAMSWGENDPVAAATLAVRGLPPGRAQDDAVVTIVQHWVQREPEPAAAWVAAFPEGALRDSAIDCLVKLWADQDATQAASWLNRLEPGSGRDTAIRAYVRQITPSFPESAARWAESIGDETARLHQMETVGEEWLENDTAAARAWIAQAPLPEPTRTRLLALRK